MKKAVHRYLQGFSPMLPVLFPVTLSSFVAMYIIVRRRREEPGSEDAHLALNSLINGREWKRRGWKWQRERESERDACALCV